jgi:hypothetical protein
MGINRGQGGTSGAPTIETTTELRLLESSGPSYISLRAPSLSANWTLTFPTGDGDAGQVLSTDGDGNLSWINNGGDHGGLTGLTDDDHTQYALLLGRATGQTIIGGTAASETLVLKGTSHATVGSILLNSAGGHVVIGGGTAASELRLLEASGSGTNYTAFKAQAQSGDVTYTLPAADGSSGHALKTDGSGALSWGRVYTVAAEQASTSGTVIDFTGIPAGVSRIVVMLDNVSTNGTLSFILQLGDAGGIETTDGYYTSAYYGVTGAAPALANLSNSTLMFLAVVGNADNLITGSITLTLEDATNNVWVGEGHFAGQGTTPNFTNVVGRKALSAALTQLRITTNGGTNTFDAGAISIAYA